MSFLFCVIDLFLVGANLGNDARLERLDCTVCESDDAVIRRRDGLERGLFLDVGGGGPPWVVITTEPCISAPKHP